jgi:hypothetical protein
MALLHGRAGRLTAKNGGFRPGAVADYMAAPDIHGSFFDEVDQFVEGCCGNHIFCEDSGGSGGDFSHSGP